jgi:hypothetical protein
VWFYADACRVQKHVQEDKINMQGQETCARRQEKHAPDRARLGGGGHSAFTSNLGQIEKIFSNSSSTPRVNSLI